MEQGEIAELAGVSVPTIKRIEAMDGLVLGVKRGTIQAIVDGYRKRRIVFVSDGRSSGVRMIYDTPLADEIFEALPDMFPEVKSWDTGPIDHTSHPVTDFYGRSEDGTEYYVEIKPNSVNLRKAIEQLRMAKSLFSQKVRVILIVPNAPLDSFHAHGIEVRSYPPEGEADFDDEDRVNEFQAKLF